MRIDPADTGNADDASYVVAPAPIAASVVCGARDGAGDVVALTGVATVPALVIGLAVGIGYALFIVARHREQSVDPEADAGVGVGVGGDRVDGVFRVPPRGVPVVSSRVGRVAFPSSPQAWMLTADRLTGSLTTMVTVIGLGGTASLKAHEGGTVVRRNPARRPPRPGRYARVTGCPLASSPVDVGRLDDLPELPGVGRTW